MSGKRNKVYPENLVTRNGFAKKKETLPAIELGEDEDTGDNMEDRLEYIRKLPIGIPKKRELRRKAIDEFHYQGSGCCGNENISKARAKCVDTGYTLSLFASALKKVDGQFGSGVVSYFNFLNTLLKLNIFIFLILFIFAVLPAIILSQKTYTDSTVVTCSADYVASIASTSKWYDYILNFIEGSGFMENTVLFQGKYVASQLTVSSYNYNLPFAYCWCTLLYFGVSLAFLLFRLSSVIKQSIYLSEKFFKPVANRAFAGWEYAIANEKAKIMTMQARSYQLKVLVEERRHHMMVASRTAGAKCGLYTLRFLINVVIIALMGGAGYLIYYVSAQQAQLLSSSGYSTKSSIYKFAIQYMTTLTITGITIVLPTIFEFVVTFEKYTPNVALNITIVRVIIPKFASVGVMVATIYAYVTCSSRSSTCNVGTGGTCPIIYCWETYFGQQFYKLVIMSLLVQVIKTLLVESTRKLCVKKCGCKLTELVGYQEFQIAQNVIELVYVQVLVWFGSFFCPLLSSAAIFEFIILFGLKYLATMKFYKASTTPYQAGTSEAFFIYMLIAGYIVAFVPIFYIMFKIAPSYGCGPFRNSSKTMIYNIIPTTIKSWSAKSIILLLPALIIVILLVVFTIRLFWACCKLSRNVQKEDEEDKKLRAQVLARKPKLNPRAQAKIEHGDAQIPSEIHEHNS